MMINDQGLKALSDYSPVEQVWVSLPNMAARYDQKPNDLRPFSGQNLTGNFPKVTN